MTATMATSSLIKTGTLILQGLMVTASGVYAFLRPEDFLARIGEVGEHTFGGRPELARAARYPDTRKKAMQYDY